MTLQNVFYLTTIIMEVLGIVLLVALVIFAFFLMKKIDSLTTLVEQKIDTLTDKISQNLDAAGHIVEQPGDVAMEVGSALAAGAVASLAKGIGRLINRRRP